MTPPSQLDRLAESVEAATASERGALLREAFYAINGPPKAAITYATGEQQAWIDRERIFFRLLDSSAYLDAAMTLVPADACAVTLNWSPIGSAVCELYPRKPDGTQGALIEVEAATPALALTAACLREAASKARADGGKK